MVVSIAPTESDRHTVAGHLPYQWDQTFDEVNVYVVIPSNLTSHNIRVSIEAQYISLVIPDFGNYASWKNPGVMGSLHNKIVVGESTWMFEPGLVTITMSKSLPGTTWSQVFQDQPSNFLSIEEDKKRLLKEKFQNQFGSQFNFDQAQITGNVPDPRTYLQDLQ